MPLGPSCLKFAASDTQYPCQSCHLFPWHALRDGYCLSDNLDYIDHYFHCLKTNRQCIITTIFPKHYSNSCNLQN